MSEHTSNTDSQKNFETGFLTAEVRVIESDSLDPQEAIYWVDAGVEFFKYRVSDKSYRARFGKSKPDEDDELRKTVEHFVFSDDIPHKVIVMTYDGKIFAAASIFEFRSNIIDIDRVVEFSLIVADDMQKKGVGTLLLTEAAKTALKDGNTHVYASFSPDNQKSRDRFEEVFGSMNLVAGQVNPEDKFWRLPGISEEEHKEKETQMRIFCKDIEPIEISSDDEKPRTLKIKIPLLFNNKDKKKKKNNKKSKSKQD